MSYFNPKIYNKQNLKEKDRKELEYWQSVFDNVIENAMIEESAYSVGSATLGKIKAELIHHFCLELRKGLGLMMQENAVGIIDSYNEDISEVEEPETFLYCDEEDEEDE